MIKHIFELDRQARVDAVCAELNAKAYRNEEYMVYDYELEME